MVSGGYVLPIYDFDLSYNLAKRIRQRMYNNTTESLKPSEVLGFLLNTVNFIKNQLKKNDEYYANKQQGYFSVYENAVQVYEDYKVQLSEIFERCPFIRQRQEYGKNGEFQKLFTDMIEKIIGVQAAEDALFNDADDILYDA